MVQQMAQLDTAPDAVRLLIVAAYKSNPFLTPTLGMLGTQVLGQTAPLLASLKLTVQEPLNVACTDVRTQGIGCVLDATQVAAGASSVSPDDMLAFQHNAHHAVM